MSKKGWWFLVWHKKNNNSSKSKLEQYNTLWVTSSISLSAALKRRLQVFCTRGALLYQVSKDSRAVSAGPDRQQEESPAKSVVGWLPAETQGIMMGMMAIAQRHFDKTHGRDRCQLVLEEERAGVEEERTRRTAGMWQLGVWTRWDGALGKKISWDMSGRTPANQVLDQDILQDLDFVLVG